MATAAQTEPKVQPISSADWNTTAMSAVLAASDFCSVSVAVFLGFRLWSVVNPHIPSLHPAMLLTPILALAAFLFFGLYPGIGLNSVTQMKRLSHGLTFIFLALTAAMFITKDRWADSRGGFFFAWMLSLLLTPVGRVVTCKLFSSQAFWGVPVVIVGAGSAARWLIAVLKEHRILGYRPVACVSEGSSSESACEGVPVLGSLPDLQAVAKVCGAHHAIVAMPNMPPDRLMGHMRNWSKLFPRILIVPNLMGIASLWTEPRDLGGVLALEVQHNLLDGWNQAIKRATDIIVSLIALVISAPLVACAALMIVWKSPGGAFYTQEREGKDGRTIRVVKLRSMHPQAEGMLAEHLDKNAEAALEWERFYKLRNDPRIIPFVGNILRRSSIDELPQLWNVLKGEMSLVGPRPFPAYHNTKFEPDFRELRLQVTPGLTGLWQVGPRSNGDLKAQEAIDGYYIRNWSLWLDTYILLRTIRAVTLPKGSY